MSPSPVTSAAFLRELHKVLPKKWEDAKTLRGDTAGEWSPFMAERLQEAGKGLGLGMCSKMLLTATDEWAKAKNWQEGLRREYLFDITLYAANQWNDLYPLPRVLIEHENAWSEDAFMRDFWKLMIGCAPLRVMFGYGRNKDTALAYIAKAMHAATTSKWAYPSETTDLVLLGHYEMQPRDFVVFERRATQTDWKETALAAWK